MITWTLTENAQHPDVLGDFWLVEGAADDEQSPHQDPYDGRHYPTLQAALEFLIGSKCKRGDTIHVTGSDTGRVLRVGLVKVGDAIEFDVGTRRLPNPQALIEWLATTVQSGDTVAYLPIDDT